MIGCKSKLYLFQCACQNIGGVLALVVAYALSSIFRSEPKGLANGGEYLSTLKLHKFNYSCEGSLHLATCWTWPSSSIEIGRRTKQALYVRQCVASSVL